MTAPIDLHLMRHGEPALAGRLLGRTDCEVLPGGVRACRSAAARLAIRQVIASDLRRSADCAATIATDYEVPLRLDARWRELDFGQWDGLKPEEVDATALSRFWDDPDGAAPPDGERWSTLLARVTGAVDQAEDASLIVTHAGAMRAALVAACGFNLRQSWAFDLPYACVLSLRLWRGEAPTAQITALHP